ncbi:MAG TPA: Dabb family protein [Verrucomicrobiae bacterium]
MLSHVVIFWTDPAQPDAADEVVAGANKFLKNIPGVIAFHAGKMVASHRPVVEQTYQVALNISFADKNAENLYQGHPQHLEFVAQCVKPFVKKVVVYDFE